MEIKKGATLPSYRSYLFVRTLIGGLVLLSTLVSAILPGGGGLKRFELLITLFSCLLPLSVASYYWYRENRRFVATQFILDVIMVSGAVYVTGGPISPFLFLYLMPVIASAVFFSRRAALAHAALSIGGYVGLLAALMSELLPLASGDQSIPIPSGGLPLQLLGLSSAMILIAVCTSFLGTTLRSTVQIMEQSKKDLSLLEQHQYALREGVSEGIVTVTLEGSISSINNTAREILRLGEREVVGSSLGGILKALDISIPKGRNIDGSAVSCEIEIPGNLQEQLPQKLNLSRRSILDASGSEIGEIFIFRDITRLRAIEEKLKAHEELARLLSERGAEKKHESRGPFDNFVGNSIVMRKVFNLIERVAPSDATVMITGESGTGKELVARAIHQRSPRRENPFVPVNCGAIPESLIESALFGHKKGAFTGADADHIGLFRQAEGGTLFLDEIGELPLQMQTKLLRALQGRVVRPVGGDKEIPINVRIIAATNRNIRAEVTRGAFREDLFYRLNVIGISLPPLRERKDDLPLLINVIVKRLVKAEATPMLPPATMELLLRYSYPGNVRELENILERAVVLGGEVILPEHLPEQVRRNEAGTALSTSTRHHTEIIVDERIEFPIQLDELLGTIERRYLEAALEHTNGAKKKAAELLGVNFRSLRYRLQKFGLGDDSSPN